MSRLLSIPFVISVIAGLGPAMAQTAPPPAAQTPPAATARPPRPPAPARDPNTPGYVTAKDLPDSLTRIRSARLSGACWIEYHGIVSVR